MIRFKLDEILEEKNKSRYWLAKETGIDINSITKIYKNKSSQIKLETIVKITKALGCELNDLMVIEDDDFSK